MSFSVLLVNSWRVIGAKGGTEKVFCALANALNNRGFTVTMLCCDANKGKPGFPVDEGVRFVNVGEGERKAERLLYRFKTFSFDSQVRKRSREFYKIERLSRLFAKVDYVIDSADVIVSFQPETTYLLHECLHVKAPVVSMFHHDPRVYFSESLFFPYYREALLKCRALQVLRPEYMKTLREIGAREVVCIPNGCTKCEQQKDLSARKIVCIGRVNIKQKRMDLLLRSFSVIKDAFPEWSVEIWGERDLNANDTQYILDLLRTLNLENRVFLKGVTDDVESVLRTSSIFAMPSAYEGFPLALIEAMMVGIPAVGCSDCPGVNTLIEDGVNGLLVKADPTAFSKALAVLMESEEKRLVCGQGARNTALDFDSEKVWDSWEKFIKQIFVSE